MLRIHQSVLFLVLCSFNLGFCSAQEAGESQGPNKDTQNPSPGLPNYPLDIAFDAKGTAFVADVNMHGVWQWKEGDLSVFVKGTRQFRTPLNATRSVAVEANGSVLIADTATREIYRVDDSGKPQPITGGKIGIPVDLAVSKDGTIYVADLELRSLLKIPAGSDKVEKVAAINPRGVFVDSDDQVWVVSQNPQQLQVLDGDGKPRPVVTERTFQFPHQVVVDSKGTAFVTDGYKKAIWKIEKGGKPEVFYEGEPLDNPVGIALHEDKLIVVDPRARKVFRFADGKPTELFSISQ